MSRPYQNPSFNSSNSNSPMSPYPRGETPVSFRTNVNRAKTKRWVEAKKYSYDGDDWGEDGYGEYDESPPHEPQPQATSADPSTGDIQSTGSKDPSRPPLLSMDRSRSMDRVAESPVSSTSPPVSIIRPADIYRRMREEQKAREQPPTHAPPSEITPAVGPSIDTLPASGAPAVSGDPTFHQTGDPVPQVKEDAIEVSQPPPIMMNNIPIISLPDVKRLSGFNPTFTTEPNSSTPEDQQPEDQQSHNLQHNPSLGFRSAVNQAFDVPETPSSVNDSVVRSNSDSTTAISPIIGHRQASEDKTPTIEEDPRESMATPTTEGNIVFKPGHRRDLSLPSPGNSPSRKPVITNPDTTTSSVLGQMSPQDNLPSSQTESTSGYSIQPSPTTSVHDLPAPLNVSTPAPLEPPVASSGNVPVIIPSMSTDNSPLDTENDRLRKEIIRSLSRENTPSDQQEQETPPQTGRQDSLIPSEYERYWSEERPSSPHDEQDLVTAQTPPQPSAEASPPEAPTADTSSPSQAQTKPKFQRRFSWEDSSEDDDPTPVTQAQSPPIAPMPGQFPLSHENSYHKDLDQQDSDAADNRLSLDAGSDGRGSHSGVERPKLTIMPPSAADSLSLFSPDRAQETMHSPTTDEASRVEESSHPVSVDHQYSDPAASAARASFESASLLGFKDILGMQSSEDRVNAFNRTRDQFAAIDTGLHHWIQVTVHDHPEYVDIVEQSSKLPTGDHKPSAPRAKFPKLSSLGNFASSHGDGSPSAPGHIRRSSAPLGSMKQGKDILHTAGVLGGQAGKAAKGLFSKGRSKLKGGGGSEKGFQSTRGFHKPVRLSDLQPDAESPIDLDDQQKFATHPKNPTAVENDPQPLHSIPVSRPWTADRQDDPCTSKAGGESFVRHADRDSSASDDQPQNHPENRATQVGAGADGQQRLAPANDAIQGQEENSNSPSNCADCRGVEQLGAKPQEQTSSRNHDTFNTLDSHVDATSSPGKRPSQPSTLMDHQSQISRDFPQYNGRWSGSPPATTTVFDHRRRGDKSQIALRQLPSVSSLGVQESDLGPPPPLMQKLAQNNDSQISLLSDAGDGQPRYLGGSFRPVTGLRDNPQKLPKRTLAHREAESFPPARLNSALPPLPPPSPTQPSTRPQSTPTIQYEWSRQPEQISSSRDPASHNTASSPMEKLKSVSRFRRISTGSKQADSNEAQPQKKSFERLSGFFGRGNPRQHKRFSPSTETIESPTTPEIRHQSQYLEPISPRPHSRIARSSISSVDHQDQTMAMQDDHGTFQGHRPPIEGYFAQDSVQSQEQVASPTSLDPARLSYTSPDGRLSPQSPRYHPPSSPQRQSRVSNPRLSSPLPSPIPRTPPSRGRSEERTYAQDLHLRSRSPKAFPPKRDERHLPNNDFSDPAYNLGTFRDNPRTSRCGDQELPWKITIPGEPDDTAGDSFSTWRRETTEGVLNCSRLPTYQEDAEEYGLSEEHSRYPQDEKRPPPPALRLDGATTNNINVISHGHRPNTTPQHSLNPPGPDDHRHPHRDGARAINPSPIELPVQADDDSDEEIRMTSTAYPGQEWRPLGFSEWDQ